MSAWPVSVAWRYTRNAGSTKKSGMLSFLSAISMAGLVVGISLLVLVLSVMNGFERELKDRILGFLPQASVFEVGGIENWQEKVAEVEGLEGVKAVAPFVRVQALLSSRGEVEPALIFGVDLERELQLSRLSDFASEEALEALKPGSQSIVLGAALAKKLDAQPGSELMLVSPGKNAGRTAKISYLTMAAVLETHSELDESLVLAPVDALDGLRGASLTGRMDGLRLQFDDLNDAPWLAMRVANHLGPTWYQTNWQRTHGNLYHAIQMSKRMVALLMSLIVALAAFNVVSTLTLVVLEKQASIAILRTLGASSFDILKLFICQGLVIGLLGVALGLGLGLLMVLALEPVVTLLQQGLGLQFMHSDVYPLTELPVEVRLEDMVQVASVSMVLVLMATIYPAWQASRLQPADVLRYE
ncbi:lipoprotein-releasing ABC transporter permease subunit [Agaribacterium sp. ZY112]|uniref:lipoprotein-releasing ABC transporter permease subunit n=1 Tax=Agaribacterium sp. ZY112 TaxID=3233574 RepID=UPI00352452D0